MGVLEMAHATRSQLRWNQRGCLRPDIQRLLQLTSGIV